MNNACSTKLHPQATSKAKSEIGERGAKRTRGKQAHQRRYFKVSSQLSRTDYMAIHALDDPCVTLL